MARPVNISFTTIRGFLKISLPKAIDTKNYLQVRNRIESELEVKSDRVLIDLANVINLDSLIIGLLLHTRRVVKDNSGLVYLVHASQKCSERLYSLFLDKIFTICDTEEQVFSRKD